LSVDFSTETIETRKLHREKAENAARFTHGWVSRWKAMGGQHVSLVTISATASNADRRLIVHLGDPPTRMTVSLPPVH